MSKYSQVLFAKTSHKETDTDKVRNEIQKLKKIQSTAREENKNTSISIQNVKDEILKAKKMVVLNTNHINQIFQNLLPGKIF